MPSNATEIKAILINGTKPASSWDTLAWVQGNPNLSTRTVNFRTVPIDGSVAQKYTILATIIYV